MKGNAIITVSHLVKRFRNASEDTVKDISFTVRENEIFGLLGPNGAGKTTTLSILCGLFLPSAGTVLIDGHDIRRDAAAIRQIVGVVPQDIALYGTLTARENLDFYGHMYGLHGKDLRDRISGWLEKLQLAEVADRPVARCSGGMKRRINLIAGVLHEPRILFLDEPTVGVDVQSRSVILGHLKDLNRAGMTIVYTSHLMAEAEDFCTYVSVIDHGKILAGDPPAALIAGFPGAADLEDVFLRLTDKKTAAR